MDITFKQVPAHEKHVVRVGERVVGTLNRTNGEGPYWADRDLRQACGLPDGDGLTYDDPLALVHAKIDITNRLLLRRQEK